MAGFGCCGCVLWLVLENKFKIEIEETMELREDGGRAGGRLGLHPIIIV